MVLFKWIVRKISNRLLKKHMKYTDEILNIIYDTQYIYKKWEKNKYFRSVTTDDYELRKLEKAEISLDKKLLTRKNAIINLILNYKEDYKLTDKEGKEITEEYLKQKDVKELTDFSEKLFQKIMNLEFTEEIK